MLSIGRRPGEYIMIGDDIMVKVIRSDGVLRLGIEAPAEVPVRRGEVYEREMADKARHTQPNQS